MTFRSDQGIAHLQIESMQVANFFWAGGELLLELPGSGRVMYMARVYAGMPLGVRMTHPAAEELQRCAAIATSTWSDALDEAGLDGLVNGIPMRSGTGRFAGFAVTVKQDVGELGSYEGSDFAVGKMIDAVGLGRVLMVDLGGAEISTFGGIAAIAATAKSTAAVVIDGACRDIDEICATGLWLASRHLSPRTGKRRVKVVAINDPINMGGCVVRAGDLVVGDETGIVVVPAEHMQRILAICDAKLKIDDKTEAGVRSGMSFSEAAAKANASG